MRAMAAVFLLVVVVLGLFVLVLGLTNQIEQAQARRQEARAQIEWSKAEQIRARGEAQAQITLANATLAQANEPTRLLIVGGVIVALLLLVVPIALILVLAMAKRLSGNGRVWPDGTVLIEDPRGFMLLAVPDRHGHMRIVDVLPEARRLALPSANNGRNRQ